MERGDGSDDEKVDLIELKWPTTQELEQFTQVDYNQILTIGEGGVIVEAVKPRYK